MCAWAETGAEGEQIDAEAGDPKRTQEVIAGDAVMAANAIEAIGQIRG